MYIVECYQKLYNFSYNKQTLTEKPHSSTKNKTTIVVV